MATTDKAVAKAVIEVLRKTAPATSVDGKAVLAWLRKHGEAAATGDEVKIMFQWFHNQGCATAFGAEAFGDEVGISLTDIDADCLDRFFGPGK